ncbi:MAG: hypothetical protein PHO03_06550 [Candidatus Omnitrophica bacterium]|nr:hypothetical protein [Candidatus Omnitrophota bacterium]
MIQAKIINRIDFPKITLQDTLLEIADKIIIQDIKDGIGMGRAITGGALPENDPKTVKRKGHSRQLIDTGELKESFSYRPQGKSKVIITIDTGRRKIAGYLQNEGIQTLHGIKYYRFFGISRDASNNAIRYVNNKIRELTSGKGK